MLFFFFQAEDGIRDYKVTGVQTCALPILPDGGTIPVSQTLPDVNLDEILASLDTDTRDYLLLLLNDGAQGLGSDAKGRDLARAVRRIAPTARYSRQINEQLALRRRNIARGVHNFSLLTA